MTKCLVVDGSDVIRKIAARIMVGMGGEAEGAPTANEALDILVAAETPPDFILIGANLPDMTADALARAIRSMPGGDKPKVLGLIVENDLGPMVRLKRAGGDGFLMKPFTKQSFVNALEPHMPDRRDSLAMAF
jgi:two-component system chemotaxis response regulator CheY